MDRPDFDILQRIEDGVLAAAALRAALELDVFTAVGEGATTAEAISAARDCPPRGMTMLLDALTFLRLLDKEDGVYALTPTSAAYLDRGSSGYYGTSMLEITLAFDIVSRLAESVRAGRAVATHWQRQDVGALWAADFAPALVDWPERAERARRSIWAEAGVPTKGARVLDLACGAGVKTFVLAVDDPDATVVGVDLFPQVLDVAAAVAEAMGVRDRVELRARDILTEDLGDSEFDVVFSAAVLYFFDADSVRDVFRRAFAALRPGGTLVLGHSLADDDHARSDALLLAVQLFVYHEAAYVYSAAEYRDLLEAAGFTDVRPLGPSLLVATKAR